MDTDGLKFKNTARINEHIEVGDKAELCHKGRKTIGEVIVMDYDMSVENGRVGYFKFEGKSVIDFCVVLFRDGSYFVCDLRDVKIGKEEN